MGDQILQKFIDDRLENKDKCVFDKIPRVAVKNCSYEDKSKIKKEDKELKNVKRA